MSLKHDDFAYVRTGDYPLTGEVVDAGIPFGDEQPKVKAHTWTSIDLVAARANPPEPPTIGGMLYPGKRTLISGERDSMKTWLALLLAKSEMDAGYAVGWADVDAMGTGELVDRLRLLGVHDKTISKLFLYYAPAERLKGGALDDVAAELAGKHARLFIGDAFNPFLNLHGLDPNSTSDVETFWREVADPISRAGAAPTMLDHVVKNAGNRGQYAYGSERKASGSLVHLGTRIVTPFGRSRIGASVIDCHRDRQGYLPRPKLGLLELDATGETITYTLRETSDAEGGFRPTHLMEKISRWLEDQGEPVSRNTIEDSVSGQAAAKRLAIKLLIEEGYADTAEGPRGSQPVTHRQRYREAVDGYPEEQTTASPTASDCVYFKSRVSLSTASLRPFPKKDADAVAVTASDAVEEEPSPVNAGFDVDDPARWAGLLEVEPNEDEDAA